jgi:Asp23 family, cell envelope-related function
VSVVHDEPLGTITVPNGTLTSLVVNAAERVDGARVRRPRRDVDVRIDGARAHVGLELSARYGVVLPELAQDVQLAVATALTEMCGVEVTAVDVTVEEVE